MRRHAKAIVAASAFLLLTMALGVNFATATAPTVAIDAPSSVSYTSVHLSGKVDPEDQDTYYYFQYTSEPANDWTWQWAGFDGSLTANSGEATVQGDLTGLKPATEYSVRLVAENPDGQTISAEPHPTFTTDAVAPAAVSIDAPSQVTGSSAHFSGQIDPEAPGANPAAFDVNWSFQCTPECPGLAGGTIPADSDSHTVEADAIGLKPGTAYEVTLVATNAGGSASAGPQGFTTATVAPQVLSSKAFPTATEATLQAQVNPGGLETIYYFEYGPTAYGQSTPAKSLKAGGDPVTASASVFGLAPNAGYHFRVVVSNSAGTVQGGDQSFTTPSSETASGNCPNEAIRIQQGSQFLPQCRAYEMVSPVEKGGQTVASSDGGGFTGITRSSVTGQAAIFTSWGTFADGDGGLPITYKSQRTVAGWTTQAVSPRASYAYPSVPGGNEVVWEDATPDLAVGLLDTKESFDALDVNEAGDVYLAGPNQYVELVSRGNDGERTGPGGASLAGKSADGSHVLFRTTSPLVPEDTRVSDPGGSDSDLYDRAHGRTYLVNRDNAGQPLGDCGAELGNGSVAGPTRNAVSQDGSHVFFTTRACESAPAPAELYLRLENRETIEVSASQRSTPDPGGTGSAQYQGATPDGSSVLFFSSERLTDDATEGGLYRFDTDSRQLDFLLPGETVNEVIKVSADGSHIYFFSYSSIAGEGVFGGENIYLYADGEISHVATDSSGAAALQGDIAGPEERSRKARVTPSGSHLFFSTRARLTSFDTAGHYEAYLYDVEADELTCVSCDPAGQRPPGSAARSDTPLRGGLDEADSPLSSDGSVAFKTGDRLVPGDTNQHYDVYQYREGRLSLLTTGKGRADSFLVGMDSAGSNVFILTPDSLVSEDRDGGNLDVYDVRVGGGFPASEVNVTVPCDGEGCQGQISVPPYLPSLSSSSTIGQGRQGSRSRCAKAKKAGKPKSRKRCSKAKKPGRSAKAGRKASGQSLQARKGR